MSISNDTTGCDVTHVSAKHREYAMFNMMALVRYKREAACYVKLTQN